MEQRFKPGDIVKLKSGGPKMTVDSSSPSRDQQTNIVVCSWFVSTTLTRDSFMEGSLELFRAEDIF